MSRNTDIGKICFPVYTKSVFAENNFYTPIKNFAAVCGKFENDEKIFSFVSSNYSLITNSDALEIGKKIFNNIFPLIPYKSFEVFNISYPSTRSYCSIDIIVRKYTLKFSGNDVYMPFIRVTNSYNKIRKLKYELGFYRKICSNGLIYKKEIVKLDFTHYRISKEEIFNIIKSQMTYEKLKEYQDEFMSYLSKLMNIRIEKKHFAGLTSRALGIKFNTDPASDKFKKQDIVREKEFILYVKKLSAKYVKELGENAYSLFNVLTEFASNRAFVKNNRVNDFQVKAGKWLKEYTDSNEKLINNYLKQSLN